MDPLRVIDQTIDVLPLCYLPLRNCKVIQMLYGILIQLIQTVTYVQYQFHC